LSVILLHCIGFDWSGVEWSGVDTLTPSLPGHGAAQPSTAQQSTASHHPTYISTKKIYFVHSTLICRDWGKVMYIMYDGWMDGCDVMWCGKVGSGMEWKVGWGLWLAQLLSIYCLLIAILITIAILLPHLYRVQGPAGIDQDWVW